MLRSHMHMTKDGDEYATAATLYQSEATVVPATSARFEHMLGSPGSMPGDRAGTSHHTTPHLQRIGCSRYALVDHARGRHPLGDHWCSATPAQTAALHK